MIYHEGQIFTFDSQAEKKLWIVTLMLLLVWFISWTPYTVVFLLLSLGNKNLVSPDVDMLPGKQPLVIVSLEFLKNFNQ